MNSRQAVQARRHEIRVSAEALGLDRQFIDRIVDAFYGKIREDEILGPIFATHITDWPIHLARMKTFWRSVLHQSGEFSGNPMQKHIALPGLEFSHFARWLDLFYETLREDGACPEARRVIADKARMIADSLLTGITLRRNGLDSARSGAALPHLR